MSATADPFDRMGHPIGFGARQAAYDAVRGEMAPEAPRGAVYHLVGRVADALERDKPYTALYFATGLSAIGRGLEAEERLPDDALVLDLTGGYRLLAHLLAP